MRISIIVPTLNEERCLPTLLESIRSQSFKDYEIIIADASSSDATTTIAASFGARIVAGGLPARGRNCGAREARGDFLFFFDADVKLPPNFLEAAYQELQSRFLDLATCEFIPLSNLAIDRALHDLAVVSVKLGQYSNPHAPGFCIFCSKRIFECSGGFDETLTMAEDHEFVKRASRLRPLRVLDTVYVYVSVRRLRKEGRFTLVRKYLQVELHRMFRGELRDEVLEYEFGNHVAEPNPDLENELEQIDQGIFSINRDLSALGRKHRGFDGSPGLEGSQNLQKLKRRFNDQTTRIAEFFRKTSSKRKTKKNGEPCSP